MILITLRLQHFKQYEDLELHFKEGLTGIIGRNGAGKSSIFEAILICLFGEISGDKKMIRSSWTPEKKAVTLELIFEIQQKTYKIVREFRGKALAHQATLYDHNELAIATGATPVSLEVEQLIGMDKEAFTRSIFSGQKELGEISNTRGEERRKMVRKMVGLDKLDNIQNIIREDRNSARNQIKGKSGLLLEPEDLEALEKELRQQNKTAEKEQKHLEQLRQKVTEKQALYQSAREAFDLQHQLYKEYNAITTEVTRYESAVENLQQQIIQQNERIVQLKTLQKELKKQATVMTAFEQQQQALAKLDALKDKFEQIQNLRQQQQLLSTQQQERAIEITALEAIPDRIKKGNEHITQSTQTLQKRQLSLKEKSDELTALKSALSIVQAKISERKQQIQQITALGKEAECPTCLQPLVNSYEATLKRFEKDISLYEQKEETGLLEKIAATEKHCLQLNTDIDNQQKELQQAHNILSALLEKEKQLGLLKEQQDKATAQIKTLQTQIDNLGTVAFDKVKYIFIKSEIEKHNDQYIRYRSQLDEVSKLPTEEKNKAQLAERIEKGKATIAEKKAELKALNFSEKAHQKTQDRQQQLEKERDEILLLENQQKEFCFNLSSRIQQLESKLQKDAEIKKNIQEQQAELETLEALEATFTKFKSQALDRVRPIISSHASILFNQITKGRYESIEVDDNFEFHIYDNGTQYPITRFSGGEIDLANLCLRIGISKAIAEFSGSSAATSLLCFDEIFGSQDEDRRYEILRALDLLKEQYRQIYIVSHIESMKDYFPNILQIQKHREGSRVEWL